MSNWVARARKFPIVQGGFDPRLRALSMEQLVARNAPGYAIGGLAGGETKDAFWRVVAQCAAGLPPGKPRYVMGIGYPLDVLVCSALGADMYDRCDVRQASGAPCMAPTCTPGKLDCCPE